MKPTARLALVLLGVLGTMGVLLLALASTPSSPAGAAPLITATLTPTPIFCPTGTPESIGVEPVPSTTLGFSQVVTVYVSNGEAMTVTAESGTFAHPDNFQGYLSSGLITISLLPNTDHHLEVRGRVRRFESNGCVYGGYTLRTTRDRFGNPLEISQRFTPVVTCHFPLMYTTVPPVPVESLDQ